MKKADYLALSSLGDSPELKTAVEAHITQYGRGWIWNHFQENHPALVDPNAPFKVNEPKATDSPSSSAAIEPTFLKGHEYSRVADLRPFGGQQQGGIVTPKAVPAIFLITAKSGKQYGYEDGWQADGTFLYFGEGQKGDMKFVRGNRAVRDHAIDGKGLHIFEAQSDRKLKYVGRFLCDGYEIVRGPDLDGNERDAIAFRLAESDPGPEALAGAESALAGKSIEELRAIAKSAGAKSGKKTGAPVTVYVRSEAVRRYVRERAEGTCEGCGNPAPFNDKKGQPYLEPHHTQRLADGGPDDPDTVIAICPNCHRRVHSGVDGDAFNEELKQWLLAQAS
jgi:5-methylcytosine-specific restriction protein A